MTRLDATSEPSMEDILASIRKIIAEDPPGSRAAPAQAASLGRPVAQPQATQEPASLRGSTRDTFSAAATEPVAAPVAPEPYLRTEPQKPSPAAFGTDGFFAKPQSKSFIPEAPPSRIEPSFSSMAHVPIAHAPMAQPVASPDAPAATLSVDAQLSDLLGDALPAVSSSEPPSPSALPAGAAPVSSSQFANIATTRAAPLPPAEQSPVGDLRHEPRQGFTVSRDGFVPGQAPAEPAAERDPFDFDLGPSPFQAKTTGEKTTGAQASIPDARVTSGSERSSSFDLGGVVPARTVEAPMSPAAASTSSEPASAAQHYSVAPQTGTATPVELHTATVETPAAASAAPSVAATLAPETLTPPRAPEPIARFVPANASVEAPKAVERDVMEVVSHEPPVEADAQTAAPAAAFNGDADAEAFAGSASVPMTQTGAHQRTMEDTVADLLRPMLRTWLAENMPRIVERALRREITEQLGGDKQEAAE